MKLYNYFRSSASFRVRIALALKGLPFEYLSVHLARGEQRDQAFGQKSPDHLVPLLETDQGDFLAQSLAIMEYLDETQAQAPLLPPQALARAKVRALAQTVACEIHPLNNLRVLQDLVRDLKVGEDAKNAWYRHWCRNGLLAFERQLSPLPASTYCWGEQPGLADCCLIPQIFNAKRFEVSLADLPRTMAVFENCMQHPAFLSAQPSACPDFES